MRRRTLPLLTAVLLLLTACAAGERGAGAGSAGPATAGPTEPSPSSVACPSPADGDLPPECVPYDPEQAMGLNEQYRQRYPLDEGYVASVAPIAEDARGRLEAVRNEGVDEEAIGAALEAAGLVAVQSRSSHGDVVFGAMLPEGGCVYGAVAPTTVTVDVGGFIMDGGCLPAQ